MKHSNTIRTTALLLIIVLAGACQLPEDRMRQKLNRKIDRSEERITMEERRIAGYRQRLALLNNGDTLQQFNGEEKYVTTINPERRPFAKYVDLQGEITSKDNILVSANTGGVIMSINVTEGQYVEAGATIAVINSDLLQSNIVEVENALELAQAVYERQERLWEQQIGTELQYLQARNNVSSLEKKLQTLQVQLDDATVRAPINGSVDEVYGIRGQMTGPGNPIVRLVNLATVQVEAEVPESFVGVFSRGDKVEVYIPSLNETRSATIRAVSQVIHPGNRTFKVEVELRNTDRRLKPNLLASIRLLEYSSSGNYILPSRLVQKGSKGNFVFVEEGGVVKRKWLTVGESFDGESEVTEGLDGGEAVIDLGFRDVVEGDRVKVREAI